MRTGGDRRKKIFLETSVMIRFLTQDDPVKFVDCAKLIERIEAGALQPVMSNVVVMEIVHVLTRLYKFDRTTVHAALELVLKLRNLSFIERTNTPRALALWQSTGIKYGDCLIATQIPKGVVLITYDADFGKIEGLDVMQPERVI